MSADDAKTNQESTGHAGRIAPMKPGQRVAGRYVIEETVGAGGMGVVYRALEDEIERSVALKFIMLDPSLHEDEREAYNERFLNEAQALGKLPPHPNRVVLYQYGYDSDTELNFMAMELVHGVQLSDIMFKRAFSRDTIISYTRQIALALVDVHASNLVHRDLKPENLIVTRSLLGDEQLKLIDFGIAKKPTRVGTDDDDDDEEDREILGTILYMAPELLMDGVEDPRTDIYAIGVILFELVTGIGPFDHELEVGSPSDPDITEMVRHHVQTEPGPIKPREGVGELPSAFEAIIRRCLAKKPEDRFANASELLAALDAIGNQAPRRTMAIHQAELSRVEDGRPRAEVRLIPPEDAGAPVTASAICGLTGLVAAAYADGVTRVWNYREGYEILTLPMADEGDGPMRISFAPGGNLIALGDLAGDLWLCDTELATREKVPLSKGRPRAISFDQAVSLMVVATTAGTLELWDVPNRKQLANLTFEVPQADGASKVVRCLALGPNRQHLVAGTETGLLHLWNFSERDKSGPLLAPPPLPGSQTVTEAAVPMAAVYLGFSPDGEEVVVVRAGGHLEMWKAAETELRWRVSLPRDEVPRRLVYAENNQVLVAYDSGAIIIVDAEAGAVLDVVQIPRGTAVNLSFDPEGDPVASIGSGSTVQVWDLVRMARVETLGPHRTRLLDVTIDPMGATAYALAEGGFVDRWDLISGRHMGRQQTGVRSAQSLNKAPDADGRVLLCGERDGLVAFEGLDCNALQPLHRVLLAVQAPSANERVTTYAISADTRLVALGYQSGEVRIYGYQEPSEPTTLLASEHPITAVAFTPNNRVLAVADKEGRLRLWDLPGAEVEWEDTSGRLPIHFLAFTPSGRLLSVPRANTIEIWNVDRKRRVARLAGHDGPIRTMVHALDGRLLLSASDDRTARLWDVAQQRMLRVLDRHPGPVTAATLDPNLRFVLTTSGPYLSVWRVSDAALLATFVYRGANEDLPGVHRWMACTPHGHYNASEPDPADVLVARPGTRRPLLEEERLELMDPRAVAARLILGYELPQ